MSPDRRASEQSREQAIDVLETWRAATVRILAAADNPDFLDAWLALAKTDLPGWGVHERAAEASKLVAGQLADELFNPAFVIDQRRVRIAGGPELPSLGADAPDEP